MVCSASQQPRARSSKHLLILGRVPAACVYCRRSVSAPLDHKYARMRNVWHKLIRSCTLPAHDMRFGTTSFPIYAATHGTRAFMTNVPQNRPCSRCIKRNIGHLCHDEPREPESATKKSKSQHSNSAVEDDGSPPDQLQSNIDSGMSNSFEQSQEQQSQDNRLGLGVGTALSQGGPLQLVQPSPVSGLQANALNSNSNQCELLIDLVSSGG